jgi:O-antigen ligase
MCAISLLNIGMANSATSLFSLMLGAVCILFLRTFGGERGWAGVVLLVAGCAALGMTIISVAAGLPAWDPAIWTTIVGRSADFSGRQDIWGPAWDAILSRPLLGYGYGAVWFPREGSEYVQQYLLHTYWTAFHGHNVFLHVGVELGLPAAVAMVGFVLWTVRESLVLHFRYPSAFLLFVLGFEVAFVVTNVFEAGVLVDRALDWVLFVALPLCALRSCQILTLEAGELPAAGPKAVADVTE